MQERLQGKNAIAISPHTSRDNTQIKRTESEEGKDGDDKGRALHAERVEVERRVRKVVGSKADRGETGLVGDPILRKFAGLIFEARTKASSCV